MTLIRFIHIISAIYWVGTTLFLVLFIEPTVRKLGPDGGKFMQRLVGHTRFSLSMTAAGLTTIVAGILLYGPVTGGWSTDIIFGARLPLTLGAMAGIASGVVGSAVQGRASGKLMVLGKAIAQQGAPPSADQSAEMGRLQSTLRQGSYWTAALMVLAVIGMTW
ncbi:MAG: hypothetical protein DHS20C20_13730 [Ardenticatenaceae bacterium]|nr:MAG: hypothetical protein DHS20C20_13730 [Ardenticatenaceae bacterium]